jgi:phosphoribosylamine---glycine ligase
LKVLVVGGGGREHALVRALRRSIGVTELLCAPGNPGIARDARLLDIAADDVDGIVSAVEREGIHFTVVGPEAPLVAGLVDALDARGRLAFGPSAAAARLEGSKAFAKQAMDEAGVPTARWRHVRSLQEGIDAVDELADPGVVVKADGLAAGKGVTVAEDAEQAQAALREIFVEGRFAGAGAVVEERLIGRELSLLALCDGLTAMPLTPARDYKRIGDGDRGPNTGGMGAYSPAGELNERQLDELAFCVHHRIVEWMRGRGTPYRGVLYAGLMLTAEGPRVLEFNVRFGDPETQAILPRLDSIGSDLLELLLSCVLPSGMPYESLADLSLWSPKSAVTVVLASAGYPASSSSGDPISGLDRVPDDVEVTHAGTALAPDGTIVTAGGRVLNVTALGADVEEARGSAYAAARMISFEGMQLRGDIAAGAGEDWSVPAGGRTLGDWLKERLGEARGPEARIDG